MFGLGLIIGIIVGGVIGVMAMAIFQAAGRKVEEALRKTPAIFTPSYDLGSLHLPAYLQKHLERNGITEISQVGELVNPLAGVKARWPYGLGKARKAIIRKAYEVYAGKEAPNAN